ncbi:hypothetical protein yc1106_07691 [Curvularia clavata]|uniref:Uncharacterized protein n=1 Tax=Curvularia clavata TaxID=95742 RepID=A0A9Q8ZEA7_CURCL|nr:hypothetical protein yc1106_07691 [Curvularia clavata]
MDDWTRVLSPRLADDQLTGQLVDEISRTDELEEAVQLVCSQYEAIKDTQVQQLLFLLDVHEAAQGNKTLVQYLLGKEEVNSLADVAKSFYAIESARGSPLQGDADASCAFRTQLQKRTPTAVLCGLVRSGLLKVADQKVQDAAADYLDRAVVRGFDTSRKSIMTDLLDDKIVAALPSAMRQALRRFLETLQRLLALVPDARHIQALMDHGFASAHDIVSTTDFSGDVKASLDDDTALSIRNRASIIDRRNEQIWGDFVRGRRAVPVLAVDDTDPKPGESALTASMSSMFGDMDSIECDEFSSALSPASYLVDLLQLLRYSTIDGVKDQRDPGAVLKPELRSGAAATAVATTGTGTADTRRYLLDEFFDRRPDIKNLQLSKANTLNPVRYAGLANEVLESYINYTLQAGEFTVYNEDAGLGVESGSSIPTRLPSAMANTNWGIYENKIQSQRFPLAVFPFNLGVLTVQECLKAVGSSRSEMLRLMRFEEAFIADFFGTNDERGKALLKNALDRREAADFLGLSHEDFVAITREAFQSYAFVRAMKGRPAALTQADYAEYVGLESAGEYWGYMTSDTATADDKLAGKVAGVDGLAFIKDQLLPRAQITFNELMALLKTEFIGHRFVISLQTPNGKYSERLVDMRLQHPRLVGNWGTNLSAEACFTLQAFIRLWQRLRWPLDDLDTAIVAFEMARASRFDGSLKLAITPETIEDLSAVKELSDLTLVAIQKLLPLWTDMSMSGPKSLYKQLFGRPALVAQYPGLVLDHGPEEEHTYSTLADNLSPLLGGLKVSESRLRALVFVAGLTVDAPWSLANVSQLYRTDLLCRLLEVKPESHELWMGAIPRIAEILATPQATVKFYRHWKDLKDDHWSSDFLLSTLQTSSVMADASAEGLAVAQQTLQALSELCAPYAGLGGGKDTVDLMKFTADVLLQICSSIFGDTDGGMVASLVEGTWAASSDLNGITVTIPQKLSSKVAIVSKSLRVSALLTDDERKALLRGSTDVNWTKAINEVYAKSNELEGVIETRLKSVQTASNIPALFQPVVKVSPPTAKSEQALCERRRQFYQVLFPVWESGSAFVALRTILGTNLATVDQAVIADFLSNWTDATGDQTTKGVDYLQSLINDNTKAADLTNKAFDGYLIAPVTGDCSFTIQDGMTLMIDGKTITVAAPVSVPLTQGLPSTFRVEGTQALSSIKLVRKGTLPQSISSNSLIVRSLALALTNLVASLKSVSIVQETVKLTVEEIQYFKSRGWNLSIPSLDNLLSLRAYTKAKESYQNNDTKPLLELYTWMAATATAPDQASTLSGQVAKATGLQTNFLDEVFGLMLPSQTAEQRTQALLDHRKLIRIRDVLALSNKAGISVSKLFEWSRIRLPHEISPDYEAAKTLHSLLESNDRSAQVDEASEQLAARKKEALIAYLLNQKTMKDLRIYDADAMFEYFLIDVQMGPQQQTSRIKQAISTIQLFVQRCNLGLEKARGILTTAVDQKKWAWMSKFTLWQANRKIFLYPENWTEPTLRDDKSETFKAIEAIILQSNLSHETINDIIRQYIYGCNDIADLEVQTYIWERGAGFQGIYHFFARTRTAPYKYYYRQLKISGVKSDASVYDWYPWVKMDIDVPPLEVDWNGASLTRSGTYMVPAFYRGRLFLFIPQIVLKTRPNNSKMNKTFESFAKETTLAEAKAEPYWEIKMGWTEYRNGVWSKVEVSTGYLEVEGLKTPTEPNEAKVFPTGATSMPSTSSFRFWVESRAPGDLSPEDLRKSNQSEILTVNMWRWFETPDTSAPNTRAGSPPATKNSQYQVGSFELRGTQLVVVDTQSKPSYTDTIPTSFAKLPYLTKMPERNKIAEEVQNSLGYGTNSTRPDKPPLLALVPSLSADEKNVAQEVIWTLSYNKDQYDGASGLVVDRVTGSRVESYFGFPIRDDFGNVRPNYSTTNTIQRLTHNVAQPLMEKVTNTNTLEPIYNVLETVPKDMTSDAFGSDGIGLYRELASPYSIYNWELGFHIILLLVERLLATQQYELAIEVANYLFDPRANDREVQIPDGLFIKPAPDGDVVAAKKADEEKAKNAQKSATAKGTNGTMKTDSASTAASKPLSNLEQCWRFPPFKSARLRGAGSMRAVAQKLRAGKDQSNDVADWLANPFDPHAIARGRPAIYMKRFISKYIEILIASGDDYFRLGTLESIPMALQRYIEASHLFGEAPQTLPRPTKSVIKSYKDLFDDANDFANAAVDLELTFPFFLDPPANLPKAGGLASDMKYPGVVGMVRSSYFPVPPNPQIFALRSLIDDRLYKIRNSLDINGNFRRLSLFEPPLDPGQLMQAVAAGGLSSLASFVDGPMPNYRFMYLLQKAFEICQELKSLGDAYLGIKEKRDAESLACLRAKQDVAMQHLALEIKNVQKNDAQKAIEVLEDTRKSHVMRLSYYLRLTGDDKAVPTETSDWEDIVQVIGKPTKDELAMSPEEKIETDKNNEASDLNLKASEIETKCSILTALPNLMSNVEPMGMGASLKFDARNVADSLMLVAGVMKLVAQGKSDEASRAARKGQMIKQLQERRLQANMAGRDIKNVDKQIEAQRMKVAICDAEIKMQQQQIADMTQVEEKMRTKYTNESLYAWMDASLRQIFNQTYQLAIDLARSAEKAFMFECGPQAAQANRLAASYWDNARDGAFSAQNLYLGLKRIENAYRVRGSSDFQISKNVSLRQVDPWALLQLQETGRAEFALPEMLFDMDFPGHYCRRIKSVTVNIPCIVGPYTGVCCTLRLQEHCYRMQQSYSDAPYYPDNIGTDERYRSDRVPITSIAVSSAQQDGGVFEASFNGERYGPFEGAGVVSRWLLELPPIRQFDYRTISDVILKVNYTSLDGGVGWREKASVAVTDVLAKQKDKPSIALFELSDSGFGWAADTPKGLSFNIDRVTSQLPFWTVGKAVTMTDVWVAAPKEMSIGNDSTVNGKKTRPSRQPVGDFTVLELDEKNQEWTSLEIVIPKLKREAIARKRLWLLVGFVAE